LKLATAGHVDLRWHGERQERQNEKYKPNAPLSFADVDLAAGSNPTASRKNFYARLFNCALGKIFSRSGNRASFDS